MHLSRIFGWHPDSRHLIYSPDDGTIWLSDVNTGERTLVGETQKWANLPYGPAVDGVAFSPDGKRLVASFTLTGQGYEVWTANADGSEPRQLFLFEDARAVFGFAWSPDGNHIAFLGPEGLEIISPEAFAVCGLISRW